MRPINSEIVDEIFNKYKAIQEKYYALRREGYDLAKTEFNRAKQKLFIEYMEDYEPELNETFYRLSSCFCSDIGKDNNPICKRSDDCTTCTLEGHMFRAILNNINVPYVDSNIA